MKAIQMLVKEHEQILNMIEVSKIILGNDSSTDFDSNDLEQVIDFIQNFADKYHHMKEEDELFLEMGKCGMPVNGGPIGVMLHEHELGRSYVKQTIEAIAQYKSGNLKAMDVIRENMLNYAELLTSHIYKENNILYPMAENVLPADILDAMSESFDQKNNSSSNNEYFDKYIRLAKEMSDKYL